MIAIPRTPQIIITIVAVVMKVKINHRKEI